MFSRIVLAASAALMLTGGAALAQDVIQTRKHYTGKHGSHPFFEFCPPRQTLHTAMLKLSSEAGVTMPRRHGVHLCCKK